MASTSLKKSLLRFSNSHGNITYIKTCGISLSSNNLQDTSFLDLYVSCYRFSTSAMISLNNFLNRPYLQERVHQTLTITQNQILPIHSHNKPLLMFSCSVLTQSRLGSERPAQVLLQALFSISNPNEICS